METSYRAHAFHSSFGSRTATGKLIFTRDSLRFESEAGGVEFPLAGLRVRFGGNNAEQVFFEHPHHPEWVIYTSDRQILTHDGLNRNAALAEQIRALRRRPRLGRSMAILGVFGVLLLVLVGSVVASKGRLVRYLAYRVPTAIEVNLGNALLEQIKQQGKIVTEPRLEAKLHAATFHLRPVLATSGYSFQFHILEDTNINAFALPGGNVVVLSGLLTAADRPEEIAGVLAHEIAHVTERHGFRKIIDTAGLYLIVQTLFGDTRGLMAVIANSSEFLLQQKYSRDFEREADDVGWQYLIAAKIDPRGMTAFFRKLMDREKSGPTVPALLSTHPATEERIKRLEAKWEALGRQPGFVTLSPATDRPR